MKVEFISPFVQAAYDVLKKEIKANIEKGTLSIEESSVTTQEEVTVLIGVTGELHGVVMYSLSERTAKNIVSEMLGERIPIFDSMAESAVAEMGNVISGLASAQLEANGYVCNIAPPTMVIGRGVVISTVNIKRLVIPLHMDHGMLRISVALKEV
ncbi:MAG TPA: chemotaxis protein CheX [Bacillota bacterium]|nr:chemotaxis protein CheX [Bacillota bacterium]